MVFAGTIVSKIMDGEPWSFTKVTLTIICIPYYVFLIIFMLLLLIFKHFYPNDIEI